MANAEGFCTKLWKFSQRFSIFLRAWRNRGIGDRDHLLRNHCSRAAIQNSCVPKRTQGLIYRSLTAVLAYGNQKDSHKRAGLPQERTSFSCLPFSKDSWLRPRNRISCSPPTTGSLGQRTLGMGASGEQQNRTRED